MKLKYTKLQVILEFAGALLLVCMFVFLLVQWNHLPQQIPGHYNAAGEVDRWGDRSEILLIPMISALLYALITVLSFYPAVWNMPVQVNEKNKETVYSCMKTMIIIMKIEMETLFFYLTYRSAIAQSLPSLFLPVCVAGLLGTVAVFVVRVIRLAKQ